MNQKMRHRGLKNSRLNTVGYNMSKKKVADDLCSLVLIDTTVFLNLLEIPHRCQNKDEIKEQFAKYPSDSNRFILPFSTIWETGNHIAQIKDGKEVRKKYANFFCVLVKKAMNGEAPFRVIDPPKNEDVLEWLASFPDAAGSGSKKDEEGISWGDYTIIKTFEKLKEKMKMTSIKIWSTDRDLDHYQYTPSK